MDGCLMDGDDQCRTAAADSLLLFCCCRVASLGELAVLLTRCKLAESEVDSVVALLLCWGRSRRGSGGWAERRSVAGERAREKGRRGVDFGTSYPASLLLLLPEPSSFGKGY
ncbi:hypothetical protein R1flu_018282 [Riccia fluitans]|uniref:Uncharacterized protein n=1 Tax=Riccia fluitans TaxID=41844 RepID=A0ABD1ZIU4_9MARC